MVKTLNWFTRRLTTAGLFASLIAGVATGTGGAAAAPGVIGHVYVNDNTAGTNTIAGFNRFSDGTLVAMRGSPFKADGAGAGGIVGSQGSLQVTADGNYVLAVDAGSNQISVLRVGPDGELAPVGGGAVSSGGIEPISIAVHGSLVYVANEGNATTGGNYTGFTLNSGGHLQPLANSTKTLPIAANPGDVFFSPDGTHLLGTEVGTAPGTGKIDSFLVGADGLLTAAPGSPFAAQATGPFGSEFRPTNSSQVFVSNAHDGPGNGTVSAFNVASDGTLSSIGTSPYPDGRTAPCWVEISHDGQYLFAINTGDSTISSYSIADDGTLASIGYTPFSNGGGLRPFDARLDPTGSYLYVVDAGHATVSVFAVSGGSLTELASSPFHLPAGATPFGIVVT